MNYLLSYPRSGNTWLRYCIETISGKRTIGYLNSDLKDKGVLSKHRNDENIILIKRHETKDIIDDGENKLIVLVRDYNDVLIRHKGKKHNIIKESENNSNVNYLSILDYYDKFRGEKMIIYYENLITNIEFTLKKVIKFLNINVSELIISNFMENIESHKIESINLYGESHTKGDIKIKHSSIFTISEKTKYQNFLKEKYNEIYEKYLKKYEIQ